MGFLLFHQHWRRAAGLGLLGLILASGSVAFAESLPSTKREKDVPVFLEADRLDYDQNTDIVTASGHVEMAHEDRVLYADKVTYDKARDVVKAEGHVALLQPSGDVTFADQATLTSDMKQGFVDRVGVAFKNNARLAATNARRYNGRYLVADRGVYSACNLCVDNPAKAPLWQIKSARVTHDNVKKNVIYRDAVLEMEGVPIFYTPYFSHPDPSVTRRQGFLIPTGGVTPTLGTMARLPYYFDLAPHSDAVFMPVLSTKDKVQLGGEWRHRFDHGVMDWKSSVTHANLVNEFGTDKGNQLRGHLFGVTRFDISPVWRAGTDVAFTTDKSYLQRYSIVPSNTILTSDILMNRGFMEGFQGRSYQAATMYYFQDLRPGAQLTEPFVAPEIQVSTLGEPGKTLGGRWSFDGNMLVITRERNTAPALQGADTRRLAFKTGWERQIPSSTGLLTNLSGLARLDNYWADHVPDPNATLGTRFSNVLVTRPFMEANILLRYPLARHGDHYQQIVEPITMLTVAPEVTRSNKIPNEDSLDVSFDETNLFTSNRHTGLDRLEGGPRAAFGLRHALIADNGLRFEMLGGREYRLNPDTAFSENSGLRDRLSDYVGRARLVSKDWIDVNYGFRLNSDTMVLQRQELLISMGAPVFHPFVDYRADSASQTSTTGAIGWMEEASFGFNSKFAEHWSLRAAQTRALRPDPGPRKTTIILNYEDECFQLGVTGQQNATNRRDVAAGTSVMFSFTLKTIGGLHTNAVSASDLVGANR